MNVQKIKADIQKASIASGLHRQAVKKWANRPTKGKTGCSLARGGIITIDEYMDLPDSSIKFYNNMLFAYINIKFSLSMDDIAEFLSVTRKTVTSLAERNASDVTTKALFYICVNKLGINNPEELFYASNNKTE